MRRSTAMSRSRSTATARRRPACGARNSTRPILSRGFVRGYTLQFGRGAGPVDRGGRQRGRRACCHGATDHHASFAGSTATASASSAICEDLPEEHNRVTLDPVLKDSHGIPAPRIDYTISENSREDDGARHRARRRRSSKPPAPPTSASTARSCTAAGICSAPRGWAPIPSARWSTNGAASHDVKNLFIVDGSVFVTSGGVNPTSTIQALALYIADQMKQRLANLVRLRPIMSEQTTLTQRTARRSAHASPAMIIPASDEYNVPGADDAAIQADILATLGRDTAAVQRRARSSGAARRHAASPSSTPHGATRWPANSAPRAAQPAATLTRVVLQCYYRDDRVLRSLGLELRPPFPQGLCAGAGRLVAARSRQEARAVVAANELARVPDAVQREALRRRAGTLP